MSSSPGSTLPTAASSSIDALASVFKCLICIGTTADARMCPNCSKLFCFGCIRRWITQIKTECPHCRSYLALDNLINCRFANDVVQQLDSLKIDVKASCSLANTDICEAHHERLTVFCSTCDHAICHKCALFDGRHGDHNFRPLDEVYKEHLEIVKNEMEALSNRRREIQALLKEIVRNTNTLNLKKENRVEEIKSYFEVLLFRLESTHRKKLSALNAHHGHLRQEEELLTSLVNEVESQLKVISPSSLINRSSALSAMFSEVHNTPMPRLNVDPNTYDLPSELSPPLSTGEFTIENFSRVRQQVEPLYSPPLERDGIVWRLKVYPNGNGAVRGEYLSVFLEMTTGRSEASTYEYSIQLVHQGPPPVSAKCITREFASDFAVGECWGYNRFIQVYLLEAEDYISRTNDTLRFKYMVRPHSYEVQCRDLRWRVEQLEQEKLQLKEKTRELESSSSNSCNRKGLSSPPSASVIAGENVDLSSDADEHDNDVDETIPSFNSDRSPEASPDNGSLTPLGNSPEEVELKRRRSNLSKPSVQVPPSSNSQSDHINDQVIDEENHNAPLIDSFESDDNEVNDIDISSSSTSTDGLRIESYFIEDYEEGEGEEEAEFSPHDGEEDEEDSEGFSPLIPQRNGSNSLDQSSSNPIISNTGQDTRRSYRRVTSLDHQRWEYLNQDIERPSLRGQENAPVDTQGNRQSNESFYELLRRLQGRRQVRSRGSFLGERFEYLFTDPQDVEPYLGDRRRNQRRRPTSASYLPQSSVFRPRSSNERIMGRLETDLFQSISPPPFNGEPTTNRSSPIDIHVISSPASSLSANTRMNLEVIRRRMRELAEQTPNMSSTAEIERELLQQSLSSVNEMTSASLQADADGSNG
nr:E3 ubiquitin protein ligase TRIM37 [Hymenolepis microstoma]